ncbi:MAG TPA: hypothetical protein VNI52_04020 [Sphingobacteriaceae bacterium]|nr:hypothetical protein [Sphingobacteriaceae bacterium]
MNKNRFFFIYDDEIFIHVRKKPSFLYHDIIIPEETPDLQESSQKKFAWKD